MLKQLHIFILSYLLLMTTAMAGTTSREKFVNKMEQQTTSIFKKAQTDLQTKSEEELTNDYGDYVLAIFFNNQETVAALGLSLEAPITENLERIFSEEGKALIMSNLERAIDNAGSVRKFKKAAKLKLKNFKHRDGNHRHPHGPFTAIGSGITRVFRTVLLIILFPIWFPLVLIIFNDMG